MSRDPLSTEAVARVAHLARLALAPDRIETFRTQLAGVLEHVAKIGAVAVDGVEPMAHPFDTTNRLDDDEPGPVLPIDALLANAPAVEGRTLAVPKVLADES